MNKATVNYKQVAVSNEAHSKFRSPSIIWESMIDEACLDKVPENMISRTTVRDKENGVWLCRIEWITFEPEPLFEETSLDH